MKYTEFNGFAQQSTPGQQPKTCGLFVQLMNENAKTFQRHFGVDLEPGSFNITIPNAPTLHSFLDRREISPCFAIPKNEIVGRLMPPTLGDGQAWRCQLTAEKIPTPHDCWVFRRIGSGVPTGVLEILSTVKLVSEYGFVDEDPLVVRIFQNREPPVTNGS